MIRLRDTADSDRHEEFQKDAASHTGDEFEDAFSTHSFACPLFAVELDDDPVVLGLSNSTPMYHDVEQPKMIAKVCKLIHEILTDIINRR